jgi:hypothetical protein
MKPEKIGWSLLLVASFVVSPLPSLGDESVTIPKARLDELERKEAELERLKVDLSKAGSQNVAPQKLPVADEPKIATAPPAEPAVARVGPPLASLPPLEAGQPVEAIDLANYYRADAAAADQRFKKQKLIVRGEVAAFDKPLFRRDYKLVLKTADRDVRVVCDIFPPEKYRAVFTVKLGSELVGLIAGETRVPIAKVGDTVAVEGQCKGLRDSVVVMSGCELKPSR